MEQICLEGIAKSYGNEVVVKHLDLTVEPGEFLTILGPSGCGKTTTLRMIAGLEEPDAGMILLGDRTVFSRNEGIVVPPEGRGLGLIFQSYALWPHMTVARNITLALGQQSLSKSEIAKRLDTALELVQLKGYAKRYPSELSGGQQQRVAVARLIALRPSILMMDEPLSNLDAKLRTEMRASLKRLHRDLEATTVFVTHDQVEALTLSDRVVIMDKGVIQQQGTPYEIYHDPANLFVAEFIGDPGINLFRGTVTAKGLDCGDVVLPLPEDLCSQGRDLIGAARPEMIGVSHEPQGGWQEVRVEFVQPTGSQTIFQVRAGDTAITLLQPGFMTIGEGASLWIDFDPAVMSFFDPDSQENIRHSA